MNKHALEQEQIFSTDYDEEDILKLIANIINLNFATFEHETALKIRTLAITNNRRLKNGAINQMLLECYERRIKCLNRLKEQGE